MATVKTSAATESYGAPGLGKFVSGVMETYPMFAKTLTGYLAELRKLGSRYLTRAERLVHLAYRLAEGEGLGEDGVLDAYAEFCLEFLREQAYFLRTGEYSGTAKGFDVVKQEVYDNDTYMRQYMLGNLLSCAVFPHHYRQYEFYMDTFLPMIAADGLCCEFGVGHGLWLSSLLASGPRRRGVGYDISPTCLGLARHMMELQGVAPQRYELGLRDVTREPTHLEGLDAAVASGLLEHLSDPTAFLRELRPRLKPGTGRLFIMVPTNTAHPDHLVLFRTVDEIRQIFRDAGLKMVAECAAPTEAVPEEEWEAKKVSVIYFGVYGH